MKKRILNIASIIATLSIIGWMITEFFGGMIIYLLMYRWILIPLIIIYAITFFLTLIKIARNGIKSNKIIFYAHSFGLLMIIMFNIYQSELLKSKILLKATLKDDLSGIDLVLRKNGNFETISDGLFGYTDKVTGKYLKQGDTIVFLKRPYSNDFIPERVIIDKKDSVVYFKKDSNGEYIKEKSFAGYFKISKNEF